MAKIAYATKISNSGATSAGLVAAADMNEIKTSVNAVYDVVPYTSFVAKLTQNGTAAPVITILQNTTGLTFVATRVTTGVYRITPSTVPSELKVSYFGGMQGVEISYSDGTALSIGTTSDGILAGHPIAFNIYP